VTGVRLSQGNTGQLTFKKKFGTSHTKTIESTIIYVSFYEKKSKKPLQNIFKITLKFITRPVLPHITVLNEVVPWNRDRQFWPVDASCDMRNDFNYNLQCLKIA
jgi:hypothetical protein